MKKKNYRDSKGTIVPLAISLIVALLPLCGLSVDIGYYGLVRGGMEKAAEAAAVAGAQEYFRNKADAGKAVNAAARIFKMNISEDTMVGNYYPSTGAGRPATLTYTKTFTSADSISNFYRGSEINLTIKANLDRGKIAVIAEMIPKPFFAYFLKDLAKIKITKEAELPPYDVVFVVDLSGSMRFATFGTYVGSAYRQTVGMSGLGTLYNDVVLYQSQSQSLGPNSMITANGYVTTIQNVTDIIVNAAGFDIPNNATYDGGMTIYIMDSDRGYITNTDRAIGLRRTALTGRRISELAGLNISNEDKQLALSYNANRSLDQTTVNNYFNMAALHIEPIASATYGVKAFIDTVKMYGTAALKAGLVTFASGSSTANITSTNLASELEGANTSKRVRSTYPYLALSNPSDFNTIVDRLTVKALKGNGSSASPIETYSYPNGGTYINDGLTSAKWTLDKSDRPSSEKIIILFTDGEPSHSFSALGSKVKSLTDARIKVYSIVLTLAVSQSSINQFKYQLEQVGKAEPVIFINNPAKLKDAFLQIADELGLKLIN